MEHDALGITRQQSCDDNSSPSPSPPFSSASQTGYAMMSYPNHSINTYTSDVSSTCGQVRSTDKQRRTTPPLSSLYTLPSLGHVGHTNTQRSSSLYLNTPRESANSHTPEPTTPRTRQLKESLLSMLSLLPPGRYLSPSPSVISEDQFEDIGIEEYEGDDTCATSLVSPPVLAPAVNCSSGNHSLPFSPPSCLPKRSLANQGEFEKRDSNTGLRKE